MEQSDIREFNLIRHTRLTVKQTTLLHELRQGPKFNDELYIYSRTNLLSAIRCLKMRGENIQIFHWRPRKRGYEQFWLFFYPSQKVKAWIKIKKRIGDFHGIWDQVGIRILGKMVRGSKYGGRRVFFKEDPTYDRTYKDLQEEFNQKVEKLQEECKHNKSSWMNECWAIAHYIGYKVKVCDRCNKIISKKKNEVKNGRRKKGEKKGFLYLGIHEKRCYNPNCNVVIRKKRSKSYGDRSKVPQTLFCSTNCMKEHRKEVMKNAKEIK